MKWITEMCPRYGDTTMKNEDVIRVCMQVKKLEEIHMRDRYMWYWKGLKLLYFWKFVFFKRNALHVLGNYTIVQCAYFNG